MKKLTGIGLFVVEDDPAMLKSLRDSFVSQGAVVCTASDGGAALQALKDHQEIDIVVSDIQMPGLNGVEMLKEIRKRNPQIPIVFLATGHSEFTEEGVRKLGAAGLIHKPFRFRELLQYLEPLIQIVMSSRKTG